MTAHACFICGCFLWAIIIRNAAANWHRITNAPGMKSNRQTILTLTGTVSVHRELKRKWEKYRKRWSLQDCKNAEKFCSRQRALCAVIWQGSYGFCDCGRDGLWQIYDKPQLYTKCELNIIHVLTLWYIHLLRPGDLKLVVAVLLPSVLNTASLQTDLNFLTVFPWN